MADELKILADVGERVSGIPELLRKQGITVYELTLTHGDFVVGGAIAVERKSVSDLHRSVVSGRLWQQIAAIRSAFDRQYLLVEGSRLDAGFISAAGIRGAILHVISNGVPVIWSGSPRESALWLRLLAQRAESTAPRGLRTGRHGRSASPNRVLSTIPGISEQTACHLLARFGSVAGVAAATDSELLRVRGIGQTRADAVRRALN